MVTSGQRQQQRPQSEAAAWRVFAAVPVSDEVRELMRRAEETLALRGWPMKWVKPELAHLTLQLIHRQVHANKQGNGQRGCMR